MAAVLRRLRRAFHALRIPDRPVLTDPTSLLGLLQPIDLMILTFSGHWPLDAGDLALVARPLVQRRKRVVAEVTVRVNYLTENI